MRVTSICVGLLGMILFAQSVYSVEGPWGQWRGPNRDDVSVETGLLQQWPAEGPPQVWLYKNAGLGYAGPAIAGSRLYILGTREDKELLICLDTNSGDEVWATPLGPLFENHWGNGPRSTPIVEGSFVYALAADGNLCCLRLENGSIVWQTAMQDLGGELPDWGFSESPLIHENKILCTPGGEQGAVVALSKTTGKPIWQTSELTTDKAHYSSIIVTEQANRPIGVQLLVSQLVGFDLNNGKLLWSVPWPGSVAVVPTPIAWKNHVYVTSGYGVGCMLIRLNDDFTVEQVYDNKRMTNQHGGVIRIKTNLYGYSDGKGWTCQDIATGKKHWHERKSLGKGAIAYADGHFYCISEDEGEVVLIDATEEGWLEKGRFTLSPQTELRKPEGRIWVHPVVADGRLFLRDQELLFAFDIQAK